MRLALKGLSELTYNPLKLSENRRFYKNASKYFFNCIVQHIRLATALNDKLEVSPFLHLAPILFLRTCFDKYLTKNHCLQPDDGLFAKTTSLNDITDYSKQWFASLDFGWIIISVHFLSMWVSQFVGWETLYTKYCNSKIC